MQTSTKNQLGGVLLALGAAYLIPAGGLAQWGTQTDMAKYAPLGGVTNPYWIIGVVVILAGLCFLRAGFASNKNKSQIVPEKEGIDPSMPLLHRKVLYGTVKELETAYLADHQKPGWHVPNDWALKRDELYKSQTAWEALVKKRNFGFKNSKHNIEAGRSMARWMAVGGLIPPRFGVNVYNAANCWKEQSINGAGISPFDSYWSSSFFRKSQVKVNTEAGARAEFTPTLYPLKA